MATILDGKKQAAIIKQQIKEKIAVLPAGNVPHMVVVQVGDDPASTVYIRHKEKACAEVGIRFTHLLLPEAISQEALLAEIDRLNADAGVHGMLVQQPLPRHLDTDEVVERIARTKDVDCLHPYNAGLLAEGRCPLLPCTPAGIMELLAAQGINLAGKHCVIVGRSRIVGKPLAMLMLAQHATVTICHSRTADLAAHCRRADVVAMAVGIPRLLKADMLKPGAVVIDVGTNRVGDTLAGDVDFETVAPIASHITPVPGGVGPMTRAMLMKNTLSAAQQFLSFHTDIYKNPSIV